MNIILDITFGLLFYPDDEARAGRTEPWTVVDELPLSSSTSAVAANANIIRNYAS
jgi:hypothetical protein